MKGVFNMFIKGKSVKKLIAILLVGVNLLTAIPALAIDYTGICKISGDAVNIRSEANTWSTVLGMETYGDSFPVFGAANGWYNISYKGKSAWICGDYVEVSDVNEWTSSSTVTGDYVNVRSEAGIYSSVLTCVTYGTKVTVCGEENGWYKVKANGVEGYIRGDYLSNGGETISVERAVATGTGSNAVVQEAMKHLGKAYIYGDEGPNSFDCSGLVWYVYKQLGYNMHRTADMQIYNGIQISKSELLPGDLVFFSSNGYSITHVGIYIGDNKMIHASTSTTGVIISDLTSNYYMRVYYGACRVIN